LKSKLGNIRTIFFDEFLIIGFDKKWLSVNDANPLEFEVKLEDSRLVLSAKLARLERTKEVSKNEK